MESDNSIVLKGLVRGRYEYDNFIRLGMTAAPRTSAQLVLRPWDHNTNDVCSIVTEHNTLVRVPHGFMFDEQIRIFSPEKFFC